MDSHQPTELNWPTHPSGLYSTRVCPPAKRLCITLLTPSLSAFPKLAFSVPKSGNSHHGPTPQPGFFPGWIITVFTARSYVSEPTLCRATGTELTTEELQILEFILWHVTYVLTPFWWNKPFSPILQRQDAIGLGSAGHGPYGRLWIIPSVPKYLPFQLHDMASYSFTKHWPSLPLHSF